MERILDSIFKPKFPSLYDQSGDLNSTLLAAVSQPDIYIEIAREYRFVDQV